MNSNATPVCGGPHCNGTVGESIRALEKASDVGKNLTAVSEDIMNMVKKVCMWSNVCLWTVSERNNACIWLKMSLFYVPSVFMQCLRFRFSCICKKV